MQKKLTITVDEEIYKGLHNIIGPGKISHFIQELVRPHVLERELDNQYFQMSEDEQREHDALEWSESLIDAHNE